MAFDVEDLIDALRASRRHFLKHLDGLREEQWDWKPFPECKTIRQTLSHLIVDDRAALQALQTGGEPEYERLSEEVTREASGDVDPAGLRARLDASHESLCSFIALRFAQAPLDEVVSAFGAPLKLGRAVPFLSSEDFYHAGQVAYVRMATDPGWEYYSAVYGG